VLSKKVWKILMCEISCQERMRVHHKMENELKVSTSKWNGMHVNRAISSESSVPLRAFRYKMVLSEDQQKLMNAKASTAKQRKKVRAQQQVVDASYKAVMAAREKQREEMDKLKSMKTELEIFEAGVVQFQMKVDGKDPSAAAVPSAASAIAATVVTPSKVTKEQSDKMLKEATDPSLTRDLDRELAEMQYQVPAKKETTAAEDYKGTDMTMAEAESVREHEEEVAKSQEESLKAEKAFEEIDFP